MIQEKNNGGNVSTENENNPVCTVIARHIIDQIKEDINFFRDYKIFKVKHALIYNDLYMNIMENENPQNDNDWDNLLNSEAYKNRKIAIEAQSQVPPAENLELLLKFIKTKNPNRTIIIILDNLDRYSQYLQRQVYTKSLSLSRTEVVKLILAFRDTNLRSLRREGEQGDIYHIESLNTIYDSDSNLGTVSLLNTAEIIKKYLLKRIEFLKSCNADFVQREKFGELYGKPFNKDYKDFITSFWYLFNKSINGTKSGPLLGYYRAWCNGSIRNMSIEIVSFFSSIILGEDPYYSIETIIEKSNYSKINTRRLRSYIFKRLTCGSLFYF